MANRDRNRGGGGNQGTVARREGEAVRAEVAGGRLVDQMGGRSRKNTMPWPGRHGKGQWVAVRISPAKSQRDARVLVEHERERRGRRRMVDVDHGERDNGRRGVGLPVVDFEREPILTDVAGNRRVGDIGRVAGKHAVRGKGDDRVGQRRVLRVRSDQDNGPRGILIHGDGLGVGSRRLVDRCEFEQAGAVDREAIAGQPAFETAVAIDDNRPGWGRHGAVDRATAVEGEVARSQVELHPVRPGCGADQSIGRDRVL